MLRLALTIVIPLVLSASADASALRTRLPAVVRGGSWVTVQGRAPAHSRLSLERRGAGRWVAVARGRAGRRSYLLRWLAPRRRTVVTLRVAARRSGRVVAASAPRRVAVTATAVLAASRIASAPAPGVAGTLRLHGRPRALRPGEFVAAGPGAATPDGLLARVVEVRPDGPDTVAEVEPASIVDAVPSGRLSLGRSLSSAARPATRRRTFRRALTCKGGAGGSVSGSLAVALAPALDLSWSGGELRSARAAATIRGELRLAASVDGSAGCQLDETPVGTWAWPPLRGFVGPVPVVVVPLTTLYVAGHATVGASASASVEGRVSATAGLRWDGAEAHPLGSFTPSLSAPAPSLSGKARLGARVIPAVTLLLYGQAGPRFDISAGLELSAGVNGRPSWTLTAPVELRAGLSLPAFSGRTFPPRTVFSRSFPLAAGEFAGGAPDPAPPDTAAPDTSTPDTGAAPGRDRVRIEWDTEATDVDLHVWDGAGHHAWFRDPAAIPEGTLSEDDRHGFGPESFRDSAAGERALTYGICYFDDAGAGPTDVHVRVTAPDGSVHASTVRLAREGDHRSIGSAGPGEAPAPAGDWCDP